jgi:aminocarboxymuconate-semialdehyde decarboxylase
MPRVDVHTHLAPVLGAEAVRGAGGDRDADGVLRLGARLGPVALYRPRELLDHLERTATDLALVSAPPPFYRQSLDVGSCATWVTDLNEGLLRATEMDDRLRPLAYLPLEHPEVASAELARTIDDPRWSGFSACAGGRSVSLADPRLAPVWGVLSRAGRTLVLHPGTSPDARLEQFYLSNLLGNPSETALAVAQVVFGEVLRKHPDVRIVLVHCGGTVPSLVGRWDRGARTRRPGVPELGELPSRTVRRIWTDSLGHHPGAVDLALEVFGHDRLLLGSDWPFPMGHEDPVELIEHRGPELRERIWRDNASEALGGRRRHPDEHPDRGPGVRSDRHDGASSSISGGA